MPAEGFDVNRSQVSEDKLAEFLASPVDEHIASVPGVGPAACKKFAEGMPDDPPVETTFQLIGKFLALRGPGMTSREHCDAFWYWLQAKGISSYRAGIVHCIAEKTNLMMPGIYEIMD